MTTNQSPDAPAGREWQYVALDYETHLVLIDHDAKRLGEWKLVDGKWQEVTHNFGDALFNGGIIWDTDYIATLPQLPDV